jgi:S-formylglutathione hydrolase FrmB
MCTIVAFGILLVATSQAGTVETREIKSEAMHKAFSAVIAVPDSYAKSTDAYPVVYLLHGFGANRTMWEGLAPLGDAADRYNMILVCPSGSDSWYFDSPIDPNYLYETYVSKEVVKWVDENYRTIASRKGRAIAGTSMGGHGAMFLALRHTDEYCAVGSMSGGLDIRRFPKNWNISKRLGTIEEFPKRWEELAAINNIGDLKDGRLAIMINCGKQDFFLGVNRNFHKALEERGITHVYEEEPGQHNGAYWKNVLPRQLAFFQEAFKKQGAPSSPASPARPIAD